MTRGVRIRLMAFVVLSAVGIVYITAAYLGVIDKVTGREITVTATLPRSGGLFNQEGRHTRCGAAHQGQ